MDKTAIIHVKLTNGKVPGVFTFQGHIETDKNGSLSGVHVKEGDLMTVGARYWAVFTYHGTSYAQSFYNNFTLWQRIKMFISRLRGPGRWIDVDEEGE